MAQEVGSGGLEVGGDRRAVVESQILDLPVSDHGHQLESAVHDDTIIDETLEAFDRAFHRIRDVEGICR